MGFRKEVREFMAEQRERNATILALEAELERLTKFSQDLMDRLMSRNFMEYGSYKPTGDNGGVIASPYNIFHDEDLAGDVVSIETKRKEPDS